jgi:hypothetical protein
MYYTLLDPPFSPPRLPSSSSPPDPASRPTAYLLEPDKLDRRDSNGQSEGVAKVNLDNAGPAARGVRVGGGELELHGARCSGSCGGNDEAGQFELGVAERGGGGGRRENGEQGKGNEGDMREKQGCNGYSRSWLVVPLEGKRKKRHYHNTGAPYGRE